MNEVISERGGSLAGQFPGGGGGGANGILTQSSEICDVGVYACVCGSRYN